jgi:HSP20 family protein
MMTQRTWDPWREMQRLQDEARRLFDPAAAGAAQSDFPPLNVARDADRIVIEAPLPGVDRKSLDVTTTGNTVTIKGERAAEAAVPAERWHRRERTAGRFVRSVKLDTRLATDQTAATYRDGILRIEIPLAAEAKPQRIQIAG